ncbi:FxDxF family PEP-CTERM protein [Porphyrobacter sp. GA68]|uniref:FxDxF family PEP-CTERM protein n=1 Tax=Porphyrobacter sp. GA68 TaxID=2883480 RepID=UPI001D189550|nr:FxDxF family PEP-CTERM protein [Porphyrobacter sp. GA68]
MRTLLALAATASAFAIAPAAQAATFFPGNPGFAVFGDGTTGTSPVSAVIGNGGLSGTGTDNFIFQIGPVTGDFIGLGSGSVVTSFTLAATNGLRFDSVIFNNGIQDFVVAVTGNMAARDSIPIFSGNVNRLTVNYTANTNASYGGNLTFTPQAPIPEPATWMMMILGFAAVGFAMRKRKAPEARVRYAF